MNYPVSLFVSHGAPTFALDPGKAGPLLRQVGERLPRPSAVLVVSPHWMTHGISVSTSPAPATIHDFGGFARELYTLQYPAPGHPELALATAKILEESGYRPTIDAQRGLDHGAWVPMRYLYPDADVPVFQVSMPATLDAAQAWQLGQTLGAMAKDNVFIVASGSLTHNLYEFRQTARQEQPYAVEFVDWVREAVLARDQERLIATLERAPHAQRAHPSADHFLPLLVAAGAAARDTATTVLRGGMTYGMLSMESYLFGEDLALTAKDSPALMAQGVNP